MLNPHFVAAEHGFFGARESEDIPTTNIFYGNSINDLFIIYYKL